MARILIGWELGANRGHIVPILGYRDALAAAGHYVTLALQRVDALAGEGRFGDPPAWQAPIWPGLIGSVGIPPLPARTLGDILARVGLIRDGALAQMIGAWDRIVAADRPDVVVADFAPALLCAARGRVPSIAAGFGFITPPPAMPRFPSLDGNAPSYAEADLLRLANTELARAGRPPVEALPALFVTDREIVTGIAELDPYSEWREKPLYVLDAQQTLPPLSDGSGDELFVYWSERRMQAAGLWDGVAAAGVPVRLYAPGLSAPEVRSLEARGFAVERKAMSWSRIAVRSRMILSHGGHGFTTMGLLVGLPQLILHYDLEKGGNAKAVAGLGCGAEAAADGVDSGRVAALIRRVWNDAAIGGHCRATAAGLRERIGPLATDALRDAVSELVGREGQGRWSG